jgi:hypothetical protein
MPCTRLPFVQRFAGVGAALLIGAAAPVGAGTSGPSFGATAVSLVLPAQSGCEIAGPFATQRRANEVAAEARRRGHSAVAYHNGEGYDVRAC